MRTHHRCSAVVRAKRADRCSACSTGTDTRLCSSISIRDHLAADALLALNSTAQAGKQRLGAARREAYRRALVVTGRTRDAQATIEYPEAVRFTFGANTSARKQTAAHLDDDARRVAVDHLAASSHSRLQCSLVTFFEHRIEPLFVDLLCWAADRVVDDQDFVTETRVVRPW
jgi:hypothetical protein